MGDASGRAARRGRRRVAVAYGPRCVPVLHVVEAAAAICDLVWLIDGRIPEMREMVELLERYGTVADLGGLDPDAMVDAVAPHRPDGMITLLDAGMSAYAVMAARLGLAFHSPAIADALTDKLRQRRVLAAAGVLVPACRLVPPGSAGHEELAAALAEVEWPAVVKPQSAQGSRYTFFAAGPGEARRLLESLGPDRPPMVVETYLPDDPVRSGAHFAGYVSVESLVADGAISHVALTGRFPLVEHFRETGFFIPADLGVDERDAVLRLASEAIVALGVSTGCLHTEVKFTDDGPRLIEVNGRVGGGVPEMLGRAADLPLIELSLRVALGEIVLIDGPVPTKRIGYRFFLQPPAVSATVASIEGMDALSEHPSVDSISVHQGPGSALDWRDGSRLHIIAVVGSVGDYDELRAVHRFLDDEVAVTYLDADA